MDQSRLLCATEQVASAALPSRFRASGSKGERWKMTVQCQNRANCAGIYRCQIRAHDEKMQRSDTGLKALPALGGSAMVGRPTGRQIFAVNCTAASPPRPQGRTGAPNLGDDSGRHEDLGTTESTEITERRIRRRETRPRGMRSTSVKLTQGIKRSWIGMDASDGPTWNSLRDLCALCG